jgi:phosphoribosylformylglycinamidine cyclo-ligase
MESERPSRCLLWPSVLKLALMGSPAEPLGYELAGVRYDTLDAFKRACQKAAANTVDALAALGFAEPTGIRGESAYLIETPDGYLAHVEEGLGTKNLVADAMKTLGAGEFYFNIGIDTVATIVNDLITTGAAPISIAMHAAVGDSSWFEDTARAAALADGFAEGCRRSGAVWGGGETPALKGIVEPGAIVLAGSAIGHISPKSRRIGGDVRAGDAIVLLGSSGVHTNGLTLCRALAERLPRGYLTPIADGRSYGEALLDPSEIYAGFTAGAANAGLDLHYAVHITGHGWRKLMRLERPLVYHLSDLGEPPPIFSTIATAANLDAREMYATFNMGAGFAVFVPADQAARCIELAHRLGHRAWIGGDVREQGQRKAVELAPLKISYEADSLRVR